MSPTLIDTNIYCDAARGSESAAQILRMCDSILVSPVSIGELLEGFKKGSQERSNREILRRFLSQDYVRLVEIGFDTAEWYAHIVRELREQGTPIPVNDIWIAASALEHGARLATNDRHFSNIKGLLLL
ncbi:MAG: type II toxin-antitoxin system VapC family toxin [Candidatus Sumerlaeota bacterium]|nr:type II toxin-antitoxin system VapC family toxin [Candidatus Sumerlaeota bacterium]